MNKTNPIYIQKKEAERISNEDHCLFNAILLHDKPHPKDYQPITKSFSYNIEKVQLNSQTLEAPKI